MQSAKKKILIVEDDLELQGVIIDRLETNIAFQILKANDGEEAISQTIKHKPDLILLDLLLPKKDGFKVLEEIRKSEDPKVANCMVVVLSNLWSNKDILRAQALKIEEYYVKTNTNLHDVLGKIKQLLAN